MIRIPLAWNAIDPTNEPSLKENQKFCSEDLARSGLTPLDIPVLVEPLALVASQFVRGVAQRPQTDEQGPYRYYTIPYFYGDGSPVVDKLNHPLMYRQRTSDKEPRYISPKRALAGDLVTMPYFNPLRLELAERNGLYVIVEGEKKYSKLLLDEKVFGCAIGGKDMWMENKKLHPLLVKDIQDYEPNEIRIIPDGDWRKPDIFASYSMLVFHLVGRFNDVRVTIADLSDYRSVDGDRMGIDDYLHAGFSWTDITVVDPEFELLLSPDVLVERYGLESRLIGRAPNQVRMIIENTSNCDKLFHLHPLFGPEMLKYDIDEDQGIFRGKTDSILDRLQVAVQRFCRMPTISLGAVKSAANIILCEREYSPFREWVENLQWDGVARIERLFVDCVKTDEDPESYRIEAARRVMLQIVSRILSPGGKADTVVVLVGRQGIHKTMFWESLSYNSYADLPKDTTDRDAMMILAKKRVIIIEEMAYYRGRAAEDFKSMITRSQDTYRAPYGRETLSRARRCMFAGNSNQREFMKDIENRRLMPVWASEIDLEWLMRNLEQLYAEAVFRYGMGEKWWNDDEAIWEESKNSFMEDIPHRARIELAIKMVLGSPEVVKYEGDLCFKLKDIAFQVEDLRLRPQDIGGYLRRLGWTDVRPRIKGFQGRLWVREKK